MIISPKIPDYETNLKFHLKQKQSKIRLKTSLPTQTAAQNLR